MKGYLTCLHFHFAEEISARLATSNLAVKTESGTRPATLQDLRDALTPIGLDISTSEAVDWSVEYPDRALHVTRICELQQQIADLQHELNASHALPPELKRASE